MSINLGIYDFFSYFIPSLLYFYMFNDFLRRVGLKFVNVGTWLQSGQGSVLTSIIPVLVAAYVVGHIFDPIAYRFFGYFYRIRYRKDIKEKALQSLKDRYPSLEIQFGSKDCTMLLSVLRQRNLEMTRTIEKNAADSIMLRNIAFGLLLLILAQVVRYFSTHNWIFLLNSAALFLFSFLSISRSYEFREWFFKNVFRASLEYGTSLKEVVNYTRKNNITSEKSRSNKLKQVQSKKAS